MPWRWSEQDEHLPNQTVGEPPREGDDFTHCPDCGLNWEIGQGECSGCGHVPGQLSGEIGIDASAVEPTFAPTTGRVTRRKGGVTWGGGQIIAGIILVIVSLFISAAVASIFGSLYPEQEDAVATWIAVHLMALAIATVVWFLGLRHSRYPLAVLRLSRVRMPRKSTVLLMVGALAASLFATSLYAGVVEWLGIEVLSPPNLDSDIIFDGPAVLLTFQALAFVTPLSEEIFFRGFIFRGLLPRLGPWRAIVISALVFSSFHLSFGVLIPIFITGVLFAWLYWRTGSLWAAVGAHAGQNALALGVQALTG
ncbi:MAG: CPBP family intramembrane metalloprotease [SAR202 cluster bacterium]|nr:CPBP family intramembrane metalloprotease [SAR202 cluster bacterium]